MEPPDFSYFPAGCSGLISSGLTNNCTALCLQPTFAFASGSNFINCFRLFGDEDSSGKVVMADKLRETFLPVIKGCWESYCSATSKQLGGCEEGDTDYNLVGWDNIEFVSLKMGSEWAWNSEFCERIEQKVNPDIGGVGILLSYYMQNGFCLLLWLLTRLLNSIPIISSVALSIWSHHQPDQSMADFDPVYRAKILQRRIEDLSSNHFTIIKHIMIEFQEAQCYFMLATQAATMAALSHGSSFFAATNMQQLYNDLLLCRLVSLGGILPVVFMLFTLHSVGMRSWYIFLLSATTIIVSNATLRMSSLVPTAVSLTPPLEARSMEMCGGHPPPVVYCVTKSTVKTWLMLEMTIGQYIPANIEVFVSVFSWLTFSFLCAAQFCIYVYGARLSGLDKSKDFRWARGLLRLVNQLMDCQRPRGWVPIARSPIDIGLTLLTTAYLWKLYGMQRAGVVDLNSWGFGQILAVSIWVPVVSKYLYWTIFGLRSHFAVRIPSPYLISRSFNPEEASQPRLSEDSFVFDPTWRGRERVITKSDYEVEVATLQGDEIEDKEFP